jgi:hypothetical protein
MVRQVLAQNGRPLLQWKSTRVETAGEARDAYIRALRAADGEDYGPLLELLLGGA